MNCGASSAWIPTAGGIACGRRRGYGACGGGGSRSGDAPGGCRLRVRTPAGQLVVICGRNRKLEQELKEESWPIPTIIQGFVGNMNEWMAACDCIITKAGPGTIAEALASGLPVLLFSYIAGQEEGNVPYVIANGVGSYCEDPKLIAEMVSRWFGPGREELEAMAQRARTLGRPQATFQIVDEIARLSRELSDGRVSPVPDEADALYLRSTSFAFRRQGYVVVPLRGLAGALWPCVA